MCYCYTDCKSVCYTDCKSVCYTDCKSVCYSMHLHAITTESAMQCTTKVYCYTDLFLAFSLLTFLSLTFVVHCIALSVVMAC